MTASISIEEAQAKLPEIIGGLSPGDELVITKGNTPVAELRTIQYESVRPEFGNCRGLLTIIAEDDEYLADFGDYMP